MPMIYAIPNPWFELGDHPSSKAAPAESSPPTPAAGAAVYCEKIVNSSLEEDRSVSPITYEQPRGYRCCPDCGICEPCDQYCPNAAPVLNGSLPSGESDPSVTLDCAGAAAFDLDEAAFMAEVEPVPDFITRHQGAHELEEIEALLELARAEDWPSAPRRMAG